MDFDRAFGDAEFAADDFVAEAGGDEFDDAPFLLGQAGFAKLKWPGSINHQS